MVKLSPDSSQNREMQTRKFLSGDSTQIISASAAVLQDLGFQISECERPIGFLRGVKERSAREYGQEIGRAVVAFISSFGLVLGSNTLIVLPVDLHQQINASLVLRPEPDNPEQQQLRIAFYRVIWKGAGSSGSTQIPPGEQRMEMIRDPEIYQIFFSRLSKAVFLEAYGI